MILYFRYPPPHEEISITMFILWFSTFDCARFLNKIFQTVRKGKKSVHRSLYFQKSGDFLKYKDLYMSIHRFLAFPRRLEDVIQKTCAIERREPYLVRKKNWMKNSIFSWRNLDFKIVNLELFWRILDLWWFYRARLHMLVKNRLFLKWPQNRPENIRFSSFFGKYIYMLIYIYASNPL